MAAARASHAALGALRGGAGPGQGATGTALRPGPVLEQTQLNGRINRGHFLLLSSPCVIDHTMVVVPGGAVPQPNGITGDVRRFVLPVREGWQSMVMEMMCEPPF